MTDEAPVTRPDLDALFDDNHPYRAPATREGLSKLIQEARSAYFPWDASLSTRVCAALAAERARADRALKKAWDEGMAAGYKNHAITMGLIDAETVENPYSSVLTDEQKAN